MMKYGLTFSALVILSSTVAALPGDLRRAPMCGSRGYDAGTDSYYDSTKTGTYALCSQQCQKDSKCKSFAVGSGECYLYNVPAAGNFESDGDSPYSFYEAACISSASSSSSSSSSAASTTSSASTSLRPTTTTTTTKPLTTTHSTTVVMSTTKTATSTVTKTTTTTATTTVTTPTTTKSKVTTSATTVKVSSTTTTTTTTTSTSATPPCPYPTWTINNFQYINSTHNLDCAGSDYANDLCATGKDPQPPGYGPPDSLTADITQIGSCFQRNPGSVPLREIGDGNVVRCAGSQIQFEFHGDSRSNFSSPLFALQNTVFCDDGSSYRAYGQANIPMTCTYDVAGNATCLLNGGTGFVVPSSWSA